MLYTAAARLPRTREKRIFMATVLLERPLILASGMPPGGGTTGGGGSVAPEENETNENPEDQTSDKTS